MRAMKKRTATAVTVGAWVAAVGSAAALTYDLNRPLHGVSSTLQLAAPASAARAALTGPVSELQSVLVIPTVTIVGKAAPRPKVAAAPETPVITAMRCSDWRELDMGSGRVQVCE